MDDDSVYQFHDMNDIAFIIPFRQESKEVSVYVQLKDHYDFMLLKTFNLNNVINDEDKNIAVDYLLKLLKIYPHKIKNLQEFFAKVAITLNSMDLSFIQKQPIIYQCTSFDPKKLILQRLVEELQMKELSERLLALSTGFGIKLYKGFDSFSLVSNPNNFKNNKYKLVDNDDEKQEIEFNCNDYDSIIVNNENIRNKSYQILVQNENLFATDKYISLQYIENVKCGNNIAANLQLQKDKLIIYNGAFSFDPQYNFLLLCNEPIISMMKSIPLEKLDVNNNFHFYKFSKSDIFFIIPFTLNLDTISLYVQLKESTNFLFVKKYEISGKITQNTRKNQIDYLLELLQIYNYEITDPNDFYRKASIMLNDSDLQIVLEHPILNEKTAFHGTVFYRLCSELKMKNLKKMLNDIDWFKACNGIAHELWPKLASTVKTIVSNKDNNIDVQQVNQMNIDKVMETLRGRYLGVEEQYYLKQFLIRAASFTPINNKSDNGYSDRFYNDFHHKKKGLSAGLLMDIFDVHRLFIFSNFHFKEYSVDDFKEDIKQKGTQIIGEKFIERYVNNIKMQERFNLYPQYIVNDNIFRVFDYHFGVSLFINTLKNKLYLKKLKIRSIVIPKLITCIYEDKLYFEYNIGLIDDYLGHMNIPIIFKTELKNSELQTSNQIARKIQQCFKIEDLQQQQRNPIIYVIFDRRRINKNNSDSLYVFLSDKYFPELQTNYFVGFDFKI
eukprot:516725_1